MHLKIDENKKIFIIQEEFNSAFPYLKIDFFSPNILPHTSYQKLVKKYNNTLQECRTVDNRESLTIHPGMTVLDLDNSFRNIFGLGVLVYRKSGKVWLETTLTDSWTLEDQNLQGKELSL